MAKTETPICRACRKPASVGLLCEEHRVARRPSSIEEQIRKAIQTLRDNGNDDELLIMSRKDYDRNFQAYIADEKRKVRINELVGVLKNCPMPRLSYEQIESRIKKLGGTMITIVLLGSNQRAQRVKIRIIKRR